VWAQRQARGRKRDTQRERERERERERNEWPCGTKSRTVGITKSNTANVACRRKNHRRGCGSQGTPATWLLARAPYVLFLAGRREPQPQSRPRSQRRTFPRGEPRIEFVLAGRNARGALPRGIRIPMPLTFERVVPPRGRKRERERQTRIKYET